jgi:hypothetical protein
MSVQQKTSKLPFRLERFAWMVALVVVLRVVGWDLHHVLDVHPAAEHCDICLVAERGDDGVVVSAGPGLPPPPATECRAEISPPRHASPAPCPLPRGPPVFLG